MKQVARSFSDLTAGLSAERRRRIDARKAELVAELDLADLRRALELTQATLAETLGVGQAEVSKVEKRADILVSTLRGFINAMGGGWKSAPCFRIVSWRSVISPGCAIPRTRQLADVVRATAIRP